MNLNNLQVNYKIGFYLLIPIILIKIYFLISFPFTSTDGPWALSPVFSYILGYDDYSLFAHEFLGDNFSVNTADFLFSLWFKFFGVSTYSFLFLGLTISTSTVILWYMIALRYPSKYDAITLLSLGYIISPYTHGYRPETFTIFAITLMIFILLKVRNFHIKLLLAIIFVVVAGLIHHIGGLIALLSLGYFLIKNKYSLKHYILVMIYGITLGMLLSNFELFSYLQLPLKIKSEVGNHFASLNPTHIIKYAVFGGPIPFILLTYLRYDRITITFVIVSLLLFSIMGRSYYLPYIFVIILSMLLFSRDHSGLLSLKTSFLDKKNILLTSGVIYTLVALLIIPLLLRVSSTQSDNNFRKILESINNEEKRWKKEYKYYLPSQLSMEVVDNSQARLLYPFMRANDGVQDAAKKEFYVFQKNQLNWITKNFNITEADLNIVEILPPARGELRISSIYRFKPVYVDSIGLWRISSK